MKNYWITIAFEVQARDEDEALEIAHKLAEAAAKGEYKVECAEFRDLEEA